MNSAKRIQRQTQKEKVQNEPCDTNKINNQEGNEHRIAKIKERKIS